MAKNEKTVEQTETPTIPVVENPAEYTPEEMAIFSQALTRTKSTAQVKDEVVAKIRALIKGLAKDKPVTAVGMGVALSFFDPIEKARKEKKGDNYHPNTGKARKLLEIFETEGWIVNVGEEKKSMARSAKQ